MAAAGAVGAGRPGAGAGEAVAGHDARSQVGVVVVNAGVDGGPAHAAAVVAQVCQVSKITGEGDAGAGVVAGDDLAGHLVVEHRLRMRIAEPEHCVHARNGVEGCGVHLCVGNVERFVGLGRVDLVDLCAQGLQRGDGAVDTAIVVEEDIDVLDHAARPARSLFIL